MSNQTDIDDDAQAAQPPPPLRHRATRLLAAGTRTLADLIVPPVCLACHARLASHDAVCAPCWTAIDFIRAPLCDRLGIPLPFDSGGTMVSAAALADPPPYDRARAVAAFGGTMQTLIHRFKYSDRHDGRRLFGRWLLEAGTPLLREADLLVPVPLNRWRLLSRRFNQSAILARELSRLSGLPADLLALERIRATAHQVGLSTAERHANVAGAFRVAPARKPAIAGRHIVLIDDVITTGATVGAATRALRKAGARQIDVLALAVVTHTVT